MHNLSYQVFLTHNSEYHLQSFVCVGVRDRRTGRWVDEHPALSRPLANTIGTKGQLSLLRAPQVGEALEFDVEGQLLTTSPVLSIEERARSGIATRARVTTGSTPIGSALVGVLPSSSSQSQAANQTDVLPGAQDFGFGGQSGAR